MKFTGERIIPEIEFCGLTTKAYLEHTARYKFASKFVSGKKVLDLACGVGYGSKIIKDAGASEVYGCDISEDAINYANSHYKEDSITFQIMDATKITFPNNFFDCIVSFETIEHIENYDAVIREFHRILKGDGLLVISTPNRNISSKGKEKPSNPFHFKEFNVDEFRQLLTNFSDVTLYSQLLVIKISYLRKILRFLIHTLVRFDFLKLHTMITENLSVAVGNLVDNTNKEYDPVVYQIDHSPLILIAVCRKKHI